MDLNKRNTKKSLKKIRSPELQEQHKLLNYYVSILLNKSLSIYIIYRISKNNLQALIKIYNMPHLILRTFYK